MFDMRFLQDDNDDDDCRIDSLSVTGFGSLNVEMSAECAHCDINHSFVEIDTVTNLTTKMYEAESSVTYQVK